MPRMRGIKPDFFTSESVAELPLRFSWSMPQRIDRWMRRSVTADSECWVWTGARTRNGYGQLVIHGKHYMAHRVFYGYFIAEVPDGLDLDHLCRTRSCVNPWHLEPVPRSLNLRRGDTKRTHMSSRTHCPQGHPYDAENTALRNGHRTCRTCERQRAQRNRDRKVVKRATD